MKKKTGPGHAAFHVNQETERRIDKLLAKMTLKEKVGQLTQRGKITSKEREMVREGKIGSFLNLRGPEKVREIQRIAVEESRLGIPLLIGDDVIHGYRTIFPIPLGEASSWDPELMEETAAIAAGEAAVDGIRWIFAPMVDIARDPRWGRIAEGAGEDPYLCATIARAKVRGFQRIREGGGPTAACPKHFAAYGLAEAGRDYNTVDVSELRLRQTYFPPFQAALEEGAATIMAAFNDLNGIPCTGNRWLLKEVLQEEWGFPGFVVSDWCSVYELVSHGNAADREEAARLAIGAGTHMDMHARVYPEHLPRLAAEGKVPETAINDAVRRVLRVKFWLGLFDDPYPQAGGGETVFLRKEHREKAREAAGKSMVLLKNEAGLLPLDPSLASIAVIGPLADAKSDLLGCWAGQGESSDVISVLEGIRQRVGPDTDLHYVRGCDVDGDDESGIAEAVKAARKADVVVLVVGEGADMSGENHNRTSLDLPGVQPELVRAVHGTGTPVVLVLINGRPLALPWEDRHISAILEAWHPGTEGGRAVADVLFGDVNPGGKLPVTFPRSVGQVPIYYSHKKTGRPEMKSYADSPVTPLYPFGHGLSYTRFEYRNLRLSVTTGSLDEPLTVTVEIVNAGERAGEETVQLYIGDVAARITRPVKELKGFRKVFLQPGERREVSFIVTPEDLGYVDEKGRFILEPGMFRVWVGPDSARGLEAAFERVKREEMA
ncbi:glycosyl hydrolase [Marinithermofilum abyssi]|uniref:beta-glucosidase n=1 Tax=Marinithermofilum abyssi TaxID=1571185 RepID=A0A8J2VDX7_9BACL|nr:glycoside hydrolase family 3 N-terminal domain-containing protein [Marinithermofilum abyssi]GGE03856.1 glycosyl hydrolase [Marinithermofilum abyssi]